MQIPRATYRLQFNEHFRLNDAIALVPYLNALGVSHLYASPLFKACAHSNHGYDVCDFSRLNPEIGTDAEFENLITALREHEMGLVLDIVPNHMGIATAENLWWWDVLKNGRASRFAENFDINWEPEDETLRGKILLPVLGDTYEQVLKNGELKIEETDDGHVLRYFENRFPLAPNSLPKIFTLEEINAQKNILNDLIQAQNYRLAFWRDGDKQLNYRRFFAVSALAGIRVEDKKVFKMAHSLLHRWAEKGWLDGIRVDHPDGLREPENYLSQLRELAADKWIVIEKILQPDENLPASWPIQGTSGYDFLNQANSLFIDPASEKKLTDFYAKFTGEPTDASEIIQNKKRLVLENLFTTEVNRLAGLFSKIVSRQISDSKFSREQLSEAIIAFAANFPVYRTYVSAEKKSASKEDVHSIHLTEKQTRAASPELPDALIGLLSQLLQLKFSGEIENDFVARFQQLTGAVMAKGVEDTAFYCFNRFISLNEVGGDPKKFGSRAEEFHAFCKKQNADWPHTMLASSTHDTKRSEDVRARLNVLSEIPDEWSERILRWSEMNKKYQSHHFPDRNAEYFFYQNLVGAWPISRERIWAYMEKAVCEAKQKTDWNERNEKYESALKDFISGALTDKNFISDLETFIGKLSEAAQINSLAQTLIRLTAPGVPDIYQGNELWDFSLVDPDNRRPVDFAERQKMLSEAETFPVEEIWRRRASGLPKLWLIKKTLAARKKNPAVFAGSYEPVFACGQKADHIVAFIRGEKAITVVPRFTQKLKNDWADTRLELPAGNWRDEFSGGIFQGKFVPGDLLKKFPVALLVKAED